MPALATSRMREAGSASIVGRTMVAPSRCARSLRRLFVSLRWRFEGLRALGAARRSAAAPNGAGLSTCGYIFSGRGIGTDSFVDQGASAGRMSACSATPWAI